MTNSGMLVCSFQFRERYHKGDDSFYKLNHPHIIEDEDTSISIDNAVEMFRLFCEAHSSFSDDEKKKKVFCVKEGSFALIDKPTYSALSFIIKSGSYGVEADITDKDTGRVNHHRSANESDVKDFLCVVFIPKDAGNLHVKKGIFVFQSIGTYGVKTLSTEKMRAFFADFKLTLETRSVSISAFIEKLIEQGNLYRLTLIRNAVSSNDADNMLISTGRVEQAYIKPHLHPEWLNKMYAIFRKADETGVVEIPDEEDFEDISIQFKLGKSVRTVRLCNLEKVSIIEDIPEHVLARRDNQKIIEYMINTANAYKERMVWGEPGEV